MPPALEISVRWNGDGWTVYIDGKLFRQCKTLADAGAIVAQITFGSLDATEELVRK